MAAAAAAYVGTERRDPIGTGKPSGDFK